MRRPAIDFTCGVLFSSKSTAVVAGFLFSLWIFVIIPSVSPRSAPCIASIMLAWDPCLLSSGDSGRIYALPFIWQTLAQGDWVVAELTRMLLHALELADRRHEQCILKGESQLSMCDWWSLPRLLPLPLPSCPGFWFLMLVLELSRKQQKMLVTLISLCSCCIG